MELWLKHYLSLFFNFEYYGNLNWLAIPILIYLSATIKKRKRWEKAILLVFFLSYLFIFVGNIIKGHLNPRYFFTLYPFTLGAILLFVWELIKKKSPYLRIGILIICGIAILFNYYQYRETYERLWKYKVTNKFDPFPHEMIKFINNIEDSSLDSNFLIHSNAHLFYYYCNKKGIFHSGPEFTIFLIQKNKETALDVIKNQLKIKYILIDEHYGPPLTRILNNIINADCDLVYKEKGIYLYKLRDSELKKKELEKYFVNESLLINGSFESWTDGPFKKPDFFEGGDNVFDDMVTREEKEVKVGKYSAKIIGDDFNFAQNLLNPEGYKGKTLSCFVWVKTDVPNKYRIQIYDGIDNFFSRRHSGGGDWELLQVNFTVNPLAEFVTMRIIQAEKTGNVNDVVYADGALLVEGDWNTFYLYKLQIEKEKREKILK